MTADRLRGSDHLLALRTASLVLVAGIPVLAFLAFNLWVGGVKDWTGLVGIPVVLFLIFVGVYGLCRLFPSRHKRVEEGTNRRPPFALRAGIAATCAMLPGIAFLPLWWYMFAPWVNAKLGPQMLASALAAAVVLGLVVYLLAGVLYVPIQGGPPADQNEFRKSLPFLFFMLVFTDVVEKDRTETFWSALGTAALQDGAIVVAMVLAYLTYKWILPDSVTAPHQRQGTPMA